MPTRPVAFTICAVSAKAVPTALVPATPVTETAMLGMVTLPTALVPATPVTLTDLLIEIDTLSTLVVPTTPVTSSGIAPFHVACPQVPLPQPVKKLVKEEPL